MWCRRAYGETDRTKRDLRRSIPVSMVTVANGHETRTPYAKKPAGCSLPERVDDEPTRGESSGAFHSDAGIPIPAAICSLRRRDNVQRRHMGSLTSQSRDRSEFSPAEAVAGQSDHAPTIIATPETNTISAPAVAVKRGARVLGRPQASCASPKCWMNRCCTFGMKSAPPRHINSRPAATLIKVRPIGMLTSSRRTGRTRRFRNACTLGPERTKSETSPSRIGDNAVILKRQAPHPTGWQHIVLQAHLQAITRLLAKCGGA